MAVVQSRLEEFLGKAVCDMAAAASVPLMILGDRLGLYRAMQDGQAMTPAELAKKTNTAERYVREWLMNQAAGGYIDYDAAKQTFSLAPERAMALADENSPCYLQGAYEVILSLFHDLEKVEGRFRAGDGMEWGEHCHHLFSGTARFFKPNYVGNLIANWLPSLDGVEAKLKAGGTVADVGCGFGHSTMLMAEAFPNSTFTGFDYHTPSIESANKMAREAGLKNITFEPSGATQFPGSGYDLVTCFDCLHDMADPTGVARQVRKALKPEGAWMIIEPFAEDQPERNLTPVGRMFYAASTMICVPVSLAGKGPALGAQAGEKKLKEVVCAGGFTRFRRATQTPFNLVLEARP
ncbi:MAG: class I SAM-dependent methyltransferase [Phycisphaerae bacterium]|nr:class I SAM-dependent methyltransferase [Phycisphaerae bacterium]